MNKKVRNFKVFWDNVYYIIEKNKKQYVAKDGEVIFATRWYILEYLQHNNEIYSIVVENNKYFLFEWDNIVESGKYVGFLHCVDWNLIYTVEKEWKAIVYINKEARIKKRKIRNLRIETTLWGSKIICDIKNDRGNEWIEIERELE